MVLIEIISGSQTGKHISAFHRIKVLWNSSSQAWEPGNQLEQTFLVHTACFCLALWALSLCQRSRSQWTIDVTSSQFNEHCHKSVAVSQGPHNNLIGGPQLAPFCDVLIRNGSWCDDPRTESTVEESRFRSQKVRGEEAYCVKQSQTKANQTNKKTAKQMIVATTNDT